MTKKELRKISIQFRTLSSQMLKIDSEEERVHIIAFYNYITETAFIRDYIEECHQHDYDFEEVFKRLGYHEKLVLPSDQRELIDFEYQLMKYIAEGKRWLFSFGQHYSSSNKYADMITAFMRKVIEPFVVALRSHLELNLIDADDGVDDTKEPESISVFLSYCQKDTEIANEIDNRLSAKLQDKIQISRDIRDVAYHQSLKQFMQSIQDHDFVIMLISDHYLKSRNCMFEVLESIKDARYQNRILYIVLNDEDKQYLVDPCEESIAADVYSNEGQMKYTLYWQQQEKELLDQITRIGDPVQSTNQAKELRIVRRIQLELPDFLDFVREYNGWKLSKHISDGFNSMCKFMNLAEEEIGKKDSEPVPAHPATNIAPSTLVEQAENDMSEMSKKILLRAFNARSEIEIKDTIVGYHVSFGKGEDIYPTDKKMREDIEDAIRQLEGMSLIKRANSNNGTVYLLTKTGYQVGEKMVVDAMLN